MKRGLWFASNIKMNKPSHYEVNWDEHPTPQSDIDRALEIEKSVKPNEMALYMECMNNVPMSQRKGSFDIRQGCILSGVFMRCRKI